MINKLFTAAAMALKLSESVANNSVVKGYGDPSKKFGSGIKRV